MKRLAILITIFLLAQNFSRKNSLPLDSLIEEYQKKIPYLSKIKLNKRIYRKCLERVRVDNRKIYLEKGYVLDSDRTQRIGTYINRYALSGLQIGSFQTVTDTFLLSEDSLIIFRNPFYPRVIHNETDTLDTNYPKTHLNIPPMYSGFFSGFSHCFSLTKKLMFETKKLSKNKVEVVVYDTITKKVHKRILVHTPPDLKHCSAHLHYPY